MRMNWEIKKYPMYYGGIKQTYPNIKPGDPFFSKSAVVGNIIFLSGSAGRTLETGEVPSNDFDDQMIVSLDKIKLSLEEIGSSLDNLIRILVLLKEKHYYPKMWEALSAYFQKYAPILLEEPPAITVIQVDSLAKQHYLIEIDATAVVSMNDPYCRIKKYPLYINGKKQTYSNTTPGTPFLSESVAVGNLLFLSGISGEELDSPEVPSAMLEDQLLTLHSKVRTAMEKTGGSMSNIIKTFHFLTKMDNHKGEIKDTQAGYTPSTARLWKSELEYFEKYAPFLLDEPPASTFMQVPSVNNGECITAIDVIGVLSRDMLGWETKHYPLYYGMRGFPRHLGDIKKYYANSVAVGNLLFISGKAAESPYTDRIESDSFEDQMITALDKLRMSMEEAGSSLNNIVKTHMLLRNLEDYSQMRKIELEYYQKYAPLLVDEPPASTCIKPISLATPKFLIEIDAIGFIPIR